MSIPDWQSKYFGGSPAARALARHGLVFSPQPQQPSAALLESRAQIAERRRRDSAWDRHVAEHSCVTRKKFESVRRAREAEARWHSMRPETRASIREDVAAFDRVAVIALWRRMLGDPTFDLPDDLSEVKGRSDVN
jgi:hypothetical protein